MLIPIFPLELVVFPKEIVPLFIFEERYKAMIADCEPAGKEEFKPFGISFIDEGKVAKMGCSVVVTEVKNRHPDGSMHIVTTGRSRYSIVDVIEDKSYLRGRIEILADDDSVVDMALLRVVAGAHQELLDLTTQYLVVEGERISDTPTTFEMASDCGLDLKQKQRVLEMTSENERLQFLNEYFDEVLPNLRTRLEQQRRVKSNGHA